MDQQSKNCRDPLWTKTEELKNVTRAKTQFRHLRELQQNQQRQFNTKHSSSKEAEGGCRWRKHQEEGTVSQKLKK